MKEVVYEEVRGLDRLILDCTMKKKEVFLCDFVISFHFEKNGIDNSFVENEEGKCI